MLDEELPLWVPIPALAEIQVALELAVSQVTQLQGPELKRVMRTGTEIAREEGLHCSVVNEFLRMTLLAPDIIERLMSGRQPRRMNLIWFQRNPVPVDWVVQRQIVQRFEEDV